MTQTARDVSVSRALEDTLQLQPSRAQIDSLRLQTAEEQLEKLRERFSALVSEITALQNVISVFLSANSLEPKKQPQVNAELGFPSQDLPYNKLCNAELTINLGLSENRPTHRLEELVQMSSQLQETNKPSTVGTVHEAQKSNSLIDTVRQRTELFEDEVDQATKSVGLQLETDRSQAHLKFAEAEATALAEIKAERTRAELERRRADEAEVQLAALPQLQRKMSQRIDEIVLMTGLLRQAELGMEEERRQKDWLISVHRAVTETPFWWRLMPEGWVRAKLAKRLARRRLFDRVRYLELYPDVRRSGLDPLFHFINHGMVENRVCPR